MLTPHVWRVESIRSQYHRPAAGALVHIAEALVKCRGKKRFASRQAADRVIDESRHHRKRGGTFRQERRGYFCHVCLGWHVTSKPYQASEPSAAPLA